MCYCYTQYDIEKKCWYKGKIMKWDAAKKVYLVEYPDRATRTEESSEFELVEPALIAMLVKGSRFSIYSYGDDSFIDAVIVAVDDSQRDNFHTKFAADLIEWIDMRRFKFRIQDTTSGQSPSLAAASLAQSGASVEVEAPVPVEGGAAAPPPAPPSQLAALSAQSDPNLVDVGHKIAFREKQWPNILYDATIVKRKPDGSSFSVQRHYDSSTKRVDLRKTEFYITGFNENFRAFDASIPETGGRVKRARRAANPPEEPNKETEESEASPGVPLSKRPRGNTSLGGKVLADPEKVVPSATVPEDSIEAYAQQAREVLKKDDRIAVWFKGQRAGRYRRATVLDFDQPRLVFDLFFDGDQQSRKVPLHHHPFMVLAPADGKPPPSDTPVSSLPGMEGRPNPDVRLLKVGTRLEIYWVDDDAFYRGTVTGIREGKNPFHITYDDGEIEWADLTKQGCKLLNEGVSAN
jgi:hypothetical protein